ncbi:MAG TPA: transglutaminase domain-containing protein [Longimicrobiaceae bacterium]|nr:transglutaminase domain-containing protein [Longimicrobiaceae bacterium]
MRHFFRILLYRFELRVPALEFGDAAPAGQYEFLWSSPDEPYLSRLRTEFDLAQLAAEADTEYERVRAVSRWARARWKHGNDGAENGDPISILREAALGREFRCVEYAAVLAAALNALGIAARPVGLWKRSVETDEGGAGHLVVEAYLESLGKWIMVDGQFDVTPVLEGVPLSALELQLALAEARPGVGVDSSAPLRADQYLEWLAPFLFYLHVRLDNRYDAVTDAAKLMLVPSGAKEPAVFQRIEPVRDMVFTRSPSRFYAPARASGPPDPAGSRGRALPGRQMSRP